MVLTGAGCSTDSGIPDYRGPGSPARTPMTYQEFVSGPEAQQRYWGRSHLGWGRMKQAEPNAGHHALARIDPELLITQNVDGLHERAGSRRVVALHGRIAEVVCLACRAVTPRSALHQRLTELNPGFAERHLAAEVRPDGDVELDETHDFVVAGCVECGGVLKPHVVFFGENVPADRVERCYAAVDALADDGGSTAGRRLQPHRDERLPVRAPGGQGRHPGGHRQPRRDPRRRARDVPAGRRHVGVPHRPGRAAQSRAQELRQRGPGRGASGRSRRTR